MRQGPLPSLTAEDAEAIAEECDGVLAVTPLVGAVAQVIYGVDAERRAIGRALGFELIPVDEAFFNAGFGPKGDLWAAINGSRMLTQLRAPGAINTRWLTEDIPSFLF